MTNEQIDEIRIRCDIATKVIYMPLTKLESWNYYSVAISVLDIPVLLLECEHLNAELIDAYKFISSLREAVETYS